jgi:hypothetical protein
MNIKLMIGIVLLLFHYYYAWPIVYPTDNRVKPWNTESITRVVVSVVYFWVGLIIICNELFY